MRRALPVLFVGAAMSVIACSDHGAEAVKPRPDDGGAVPCVDAGCPVVLARGSAPTSVVVDDTNAYFATCSDRAGAVQRVPLLGGPTVLVALLPGCAAELVLDATSIYVVDASGEVAKIPKDGGPPTVLAFGLGAPSGIAVDDANAYFTASDSVMAVPKDGGNVTTLSPSATSPTRPVIDATNVYWGEQRTGWIRSVPKTGGPFVPVASNLATVTDIALANGEIYFGGAYGLSKISVAGGAPVGLGTADGAAIGAITTDGVRVYYVGGDSAIFSAPVNPGAVTVRASAEGSPTSIAVDGTSIYFTTDDSYADPESPSGRVVKIAPK